MDDMKKSKSPEGKRYQGYDMDKVIVQNRTRKKGWFWQILGISLVLSVIIIGISCVVALHQKKKQTDYMSKINDSNSLELLLDDHSNVTITQSFTGLKDENDYKKVRFLRETKQGGLYSYLKTEGLMNDFKELISDENYYRNDGNFTYYFGMVGDDYENVLNEINKEVIQLVGTEAIVDQVESSDRMKVTLNYEVQAGDGYTKAYGFKTGTIIQKVLTIDKESLLVMSDVETVNEEEIYVYTVTFDGENKMPQFYKNAKAKKTKRNCTVFYDYQGENEQEYTFTIPVDTYFTLLNHDGYRLFMEEACLTEFNNSQMQLQNPYSDLTLYLKKD